MRLVRGERFSFDPAMIVDGVPAINPSLEPMYFGHSQGTTGAVAHANTHAIAQPGTEETRAALADRILCILFVSFMSRAF